jgi:hypothetical protein
VKLRVTIVRISGDEDGLYGSVALKKVLELQLHLRQGGGARRGGEILAAPVQRKERHVAQDLGHKPVPFRHQRWGKAHAAQPPPQHTPSHTTAAAA